MLCARDNVRTFQRGGRIFLHALRARCKVGRGCQEALARSEEGRSAATDRMNALAHESEERLREKMRAETELAAAKQKIEIMPGKALGDSRVSRRKNRGSKLSYNRKTRYKKSHRAPRRA